MGLSVYEEGGHEVWFTHGNHYLRIYYDPTGFENHFICCENCKLTLSWDGNRDFDSKLAEERFKNLLDSCELVMIADVMES